MKQTLLMPKIILFLLNHQQTPKKFSVRTKKNGLVGIMETNNFFMPH